MFGLFHNDIANKLACSKINSTFMNLLLNDGVVYNNSSYNISTAKI